MEYDYKNYIKESCSLLNKLEGLILEDILINIVDPEFNVVYLKTSNQTFSLQGEMGSEYLGVHTLENMPKTTNQEGYIICKHPPFEPFIGKTIAQARQIGSAWNGHGFEFTFEGIPTKSMIVQSIYCGIKLDELNDCLRLGVGDYENEWRGQQKA